MSKARFVCLLTLVMGGMLVRCEANEAAQDPQQKLLALKKNGTVYIRSYFSADQDVLITVAKGANGQINFGNTRLIPASVPTDEAAFAQGLVFHRCGDDSTPWALNGTYIGANHGCSQGREVIAPKHGLTAADLGSEWTDAATNKFYVIKVPGPDNVWMLSENKSTNEVWKFSEIKGAVLKNGAGNKTLDAKEIKMAQVIPACRIKKQKYLVNGQAPLEEGRATPCEYLDIEEEYDIIAPDSLLKAIRNNPGKETSFTDDRLDSVVNNRIVYRFLPMGACTVEHLSTAMRPFKLGSMGFIQSAPLIKDGFDSYSYYIPKTRPFEIKGVKFDFASIQDFSVKLPDYLYFNRDKIENTNNPPDRFIQFLGKTEQGTNVNKIGYALGYSLLEGITRPETRSRQAEYAAGINPGSYKTYPYAIMSPTQNATIPAGKKFHCLAYRQYFNPSAYRNATCVYWHKQGNSYILHIDYHKLVDRDVIRLPSCLAGKKMTIVEKTPSVKLITEDPVDPVNITLSVNDRHGYIILKYD